MEKKGSMHFEMVISFVFFVGFASFLFFTIEPYDTSTLSYSALNALETSFYENAEEDLISFSIYVSSPGGCSSVDLSNSGFMIVPDADAGSSVIGNNQEFDSKIDTAILYFNTDNNVNLYKALISKGLTDDSGVSGSCQSVGVGDYLASLEEKKIISIKNLNNTKGKYDADYEGLKSDLKIPEIFDFEITSADLNELDMKRGVPSSSEVIARESVHEVLLENGTIINSRFTIRLW